jgi:hypothetical protein
MTRHRYRAVLLLFLLLNLTACSTWQSVGPVSPSQFIEAEQPERVRVYIRGGGQVELENPSVEGDALVVPNVSMPLVDIIGLEVREFSMDRTMILLGGVAAGVLLVAVAVVLNTIEICDGSIC